MKILTRILLGFAIILILILVVIPLILRMAFPEKGLRELVLPSVEAALGRSVDCSRLALGLSWRGVQLKMEDLEIGQDPSGYGLREVRLEKLEAGLALTPLLRKELELRSLRLDEPRLEILLRPGDAPPLAGADSSAAVTTPAALAVAAPDVQIRAGSLRLRQEEDLLLETEISEARIASVLEADGRLSLDAWLELEALRILQPGESKTEASARVDLSFGLDQERWELPRCLVGLRDVEVTNLAPGREPRPSWLIEAVDMEMIAAGSRTSLAAESFDPRSLDLDGKVEARGLQLNSSGSDFGLNDFELPRLRMDIVSKSGESDAPFSQRVLIEEPRLKLLLPRVADSGGRSLKASRRGTLEADGSLVPTETQPLSIGGALGALLLSDAEIRLEKGAIEFQQEMGPAFFINVSTARIESALGESASAERAPVDLSASFDLDPIRVERAEQLKGEGSARLEFVCQLGDESIEIQSGKFAMQALSMSTWSKQGERFDIDGNGAQLLFSGITPYKALKHGLEELNPNVQLTVRPITLESEALAKPVQISAQLQGPMQNMGLERLHLRSGSSEMTVTGSLDGLFPPEASLELSSPGLDLADFTLVPTTRSEATADSGEVAQTFIPAIPIFGTLDFSIDRLQSSKANFENVCGRLRASESGVVLENLTAGLFGGTMSGGLSLSPQTDGSALCDGAFQVQEVAASPFLSAFTPVKKGVSGDLTSDFDFRVSLVPGSKPRDLDLTARLDVIDTVLDNPSTLKSLSQAVGLKAQESYTLGHLHQNLEVREDRVITENILFPLEDGELRGSGSAGLNGELDYRGTWIMGPRTASRLGTDSPLRLLADEQGRINIDFLLRGNVDHPQVTLDQSSIERRLREVAEKKLRQDGEELLKKGVDELLKNLK